MKASDVSVQDFVGGLKKAFIIPPFQRNYAWVEDQCHELFDDIMRCVESGGSHYIGNRSQSFADFGIHLVKRTDKADG